MKSLRQKTLTMALFGLLAANASWNLINNEGNSYFAGQTIVESASLASVSTVTPKAKVKGEVSVSDFTDMVLAVGGKVDYNSLEERSATGLRTITIELKDDQARRIPGYHDKISFFRSNSAKDQGVTFAEAVSRDDEWTTNNSRIITLKVLDNVELKNPMEVEDKYGTKIKSKVRLYKNGVETNDFGEITKVKYRVKMNVTEGQDTSYCESCFEDFEISATLADLKDGMAGIVKMIDDKFGKEKTQHDKEKLEELRRICKGPDYFDGSDEQVECLAARKAGKVATDEKRSKPVKLSASEKKIINDNLDSILTEEYKEDLESERFDEIAAKYPVFKKMVKVSQKKVKLELKKEEEIEENEEKTEIITEALESELEYIESNIRQLDKNTRNFEYLINYATRDLDQMVASCDSMSPYYSQSNSRRSYFGNSYSAGFSFNFRDGFQSYAGPTRGSRMTTAPNVNALGGNNQFAMWQQQWDQMNRQNAEMIRQNCMQQVASAEQYYNWEIGNYEDSRISPLQWEIANTLDRLDVKRIFPATYSKEKNYNGGISRDDLNDYIEQINAFRKDVQSMGSGLGIATTRNQDLLYRGATRNNRQNSMTARTSNNPRYNNRSRTRTNNTNPTAVRGRQSIRGTYLQ